MSAILVQFALAAFGLTALWLAMGTGARGRRWAPLAGLCGQPFWMVYAVQSKGWGLLALACVYSAVYMRGAWLQWRPQR